MQPDTLIRLGCFALVLLAMGLFEAWWPRRARVLSRIRRWPSNIALSALNQALVRLLVPISGVALAEHAEFQGWGLLAHLPLTPAVEIVVAVLTLDLAIYWQHRLFHQIPWLWRLHRMHHADLDFDLTTGIRFHPISVLISAMIKLAVILLLGAPALAVLCFEVLLNATSVFNHANLDLPRALDRRLRWLVVTPDVHRVHHSIDPLETNSNFGFNFPWWDRIFATYTAQPSLGHNDMTVGLVEFRNPIEQRFDRLLSQPFRDN